MLSKDVRPQNPAQYLRGSSRRCPANYPRGSQKNTAETCLTRMSPGEPMWPRAAFEGSCLAHVDAGGFLSYAARLSDLPPQLAASFICDLGGPLVAAPPRHSHSSCYHRSKFGDR